jgi:aminocarboxymuconate-semialdehyde decarboxylase
VRIDVHAHYYPPELVQRMGELGRSLEAAVRITCECPIQQRLDLLDQTGVDAQVLSMGVQQPYLADQEKAKIAARFSNDVYQDVVARFGARFAAFGCLPLPHVSAAVDEAVYCLDELRMAGINLGCSVGGRALEDPGFEPLWAELNTRRAVVFLHPTSLGGPMLDAPGLPMLLGSRFEDTAAAVRLVISGLTSRFPEVKIIVPHLGGAIPFMWERMDDVANRGLGESPKEGLKRLYYDTVNKGAAALRCACEVLDPSHLMLGSDFPYMKAASEYAGHLTYIEQSGLPAATIAGILNRNAQALLSLPESKPV